MKNRLKRVKRLKANESFLIFGGQSTLENRPRFVDFGGVLVSTGMLIYDGPGQHF